ncbi:hypothetical protein BC834DRAFT_475157 [Gloeopeniophorella convolvens]|nr:hypothetical protein BC834DRAFT_475157 [Gloeopeniophorella convolvens]
MDAIPVPKGLKCAVQQVRKDAAGRNSALALDRSPVTAHHLIFSYADTYPEMWATYPLVNLVTWLPQALRGQCPVSFRCRTFETFSLSFGKTKRLWACSRA